MKFMVKLIEVENTADCQARKCLKANCEHVTGNLWLYEGDSFCLQGVDFKIIDEQPIDSFGSLSGKELIKMVEDNFNLDLSKIEKIKKANDTLKWMAELAVDDKNLLEFILVLSNSSIEKLIKLISKSDYKPMNTKYPEGMQV